MSRRSIAAEGSREETPDPRLATDQDCSRNPFAPGVLTARIRELLDQAS